MTSVFTAELGKCVRKRSHAVHSIRVGALTVFPTSSFSMTDKSRGEYPSQASKLNLTHITDQLLQHRTSFHAVRDLRENDPLKAVELNLRGSQFLKSFRVAGNNDDLSRAINAYEEAVSYLSGDDPKLAGFLNNVVDGYGARFMRFGKLDDLEKAITIGQKVVEMTTTDDANFPSRLNDLAIAYSRRFAHLGRMNDISEAIRRHQQVIRLTPDDILIFQRFFLECGSWSLHLQNDENVGTSCVSGTNKGQISRFCIGRCPPPMTGHNWVVTSHGS